MTRTIFAAAAIAVVALVPQMPAMAQSDNDITVSAPAPRTDQPRRGVQPRIQLVSQMTVYTDDLDLRTAYGREALNARVWQAADATCDRLDAIDPPLVSGGDNGNCRHLAMKAAEPQLRAAIRAAS